MRFNELAVIALSGLTLAHPGHHEHLDARSIVAKRDFLRNARRSLNQCADHLEKRGVHERAAARRAAIYEANRKRTILSRDYNDAVNTSHHSRLAVSVNTPESMLFAKDPVCILNPEAEVGPFWVKGEHIRTNIRDGQPGVSIILDGQFIDIETCEPIRDLWWDVWNCNATGVYSGVQSSMNGNGNDSSNLDKTFLRGIQKTDADGVAQFHTLFPGHYDGRATHVHVIAHTKSHVLPNNTLTGGHISHVGQLFFDQDLINEVEATYPYNTNTVSITENADDSVVKDETEDTASDPFFSWAYLGDSVQDGLFGWITIGVNTSASYDSDATYAATLTSSGGVSNPDSTF